MRCLRCDKESEKMDVCSHCGVSLKDQVSDIIKDLGKKKSPKKNLIKSLSTTKDLRAVKPIVDIAMGDEDTECRIEAIKALAKLEDRDVVPYLVQLLLKDRASEIRSASAKAIGILKGHKAIDALEKALNDNAAEVKISSIEALKQLGSRDAVNMIGRMLTGQDPRVERAAFKALQKMGYQIIYDGDRVSQIRPAQRSNTPAFIVPLIIISAIVAGLFFLYKTFGNPEKRYVSSLKSVVEAGKSYSDELFALNRELEKGLDPAMLDVINTKSGGLEAKFRTLRNKLKGLDPPPQYAAMQKEMEDIMDSLVYQCRVMVSANLYSDFAGHIKDNYDVIESCQSKITSIKKELNDIEMNQ